MVVLLLVCATALVVLVGLPDRRPTVQISLISSPKLEPNAAVFYVADAGSVDTTQVTQNCYRADFEIENLGPGSIVFPYRGTFSLEVQQTNSTKWRSANQSSLGYIPPPLRQGASETYSVRIPADATRWRVTTTFRRYQLLMQVLNWAIRDLLGANKEFGDRKDYEAESPAWEIPLDTNSSPAISS